VRTATKRAGGTVHNHGGSPGKRLGIKKFSGMFDLSLSENRAFNSVLRPIRHPWQHHRPTTRDSIPPRSSCMFSISPSYFFFLTETGKDGTRSHDLRCRARICPLLQGKISQRPTEIRGCRAESGREIATGRVQSWS
jgi:hypothetical protein